MQIRKSYFFQRLQRFADLCSPEEFPCLCNSQIHHFRNILSIYFVLQNFFWIPKSFTHITGRLDVIHKCHSRTLSCAVKRKQRCLLTAPLCKYFPDFICDSQIGRRSGSETCTCSALAYKHHILSHTAVKAFHQRTFSGSGNTSDHNQISYWKFDGNVLQIVKMDMLHPPYSFRFPCLCF